MSIISHKTKSTLEVCLGLFIVFFYLWGIYPLYKSWLHIFFYMLFLGLLVYSKQSHHESLRELGLGRDNCLPSMKMLFPMTLFSIVGVSIIWSLFNPINLNFYQEGKFWLRLITYPLWALFQQYIVLAFFFRRLRDVFYPHYSLAIIFSAAIFSAIHIPNPPLMILTFLGGLFWAWVYHKYPNLFTISASHVLLGLLCAYVLLVYSDVGPYADAGRWTKTVIAHGWIDSVNGSVRDKKPKIILSSQEKTIKIRGWAVALEGKIDKVFVHMGKNAYLASYGFERKDVAIHLGSPSYINSGFHVRIPITRVKPGLNAVYVKVFLEGRTFARHVGQKVWIRVE